MKVRKAIIPAIGWGTRMLPITSVVPKELLPVCGKPVIQYVVEEAVNAGIEEIILVLNKGNESIAEYFQPNQKLEKMLLKNGLHDELRNLESIWNMARISVIYQDEQKGLGDAVLGASNVIGNEPFAVLLGDNIIQTDDCESFTKKLVDAFQKYDRSVLGVQKVASCALHKHSILEGAEFDGGIYHAKRLHHKSEKHETGSDLAFCARYIFKPEIFNYLRETAMGKNNEVQLTETMVQIVPNEDLIGIKLEGESYSVEDPNGLLLANLSMTEFGCD